MFFTKKIIVMCSLCGLMTLVLNAQVTIGSGISPHKGALLDLKEFEGAGATATRGLLLPRVKLTDVKPEVGKLAESIGNTENWVEAEHIGLLVYNAVNTKIPAYLRGAYPGIYSWNGSEWTPMFEDKPILPPETTTDEFVGANCYILTVGGSTVKIPAKRGLDIWNAYTGSNSSTGEVLDINILGILPLTSYTTQIVWQEASDASNNDVISTVKISGTTTEPILEVTSGSKNGNALISLSSGSTGEVIWMWHIWVAEDDPTANPIYFTNSAGKDYWLMRTNLGAMDINKVTYNKADPSTASSHGLYYQWGRHTPFRQFTNNPIYSPTVGAIEGELLTYALQNPNFILYFSTSSHDWYSSTSNIWNTRWADKNAQDEDIKSPFDPCPYGWRVPNMDTNESAWQGLDNAAVAKNGSGVDTGIGYFPFSGYLADGDAKLGDAGQNAYIWSANSLLQVNASNLFIEDTVVHSQYGMNKANALSVRCVKDMKKE